MERGNKLAQLHKKWTGCEKCRLHEHRHTQVFGKGSAYPILMVVGGAPTSDDEVKGTPFCGAPGRLLAEFMKRTGVDLTRVFLTYTVACKTPLRRIALYDEMRECNPRLTRQVAILRPKAILCLGSQASTSILGEAFVPNSRGRWRTSSWEIRKKNGETVNLEIPGISSFSPEQCLQPGWERNSLLLDVAEAWKRAVELNNERLS